MRPKGVRSLWRGLRRAGGLAGALLCVAAPAAAGSGLFTFVDERGVVHFTNVPADPRYSPVPEPDPAQRHARGAPANMHFDGLIVLSALQERLPPALIKAVIAAESRFDPDAVSRKGAQGLMQLMPRTARRLGVEDPFQPTENVRGGSRYLRQLIDRYGDWSRALAAYNAGPAAVDRHRGIPPYRETRDYVKRVLTYYHAYHGDFGR